MTKYGYVYAGRRNYSALTDFKDETFAYTYLNEQENIGNPQLFPAVTKTMAAPQLCLLQYKTITQRIDLHSLTVTLCQVAVRVLLTVYSLQVLLLNQYIYALLQKHNQTGKTSTCRRLASVVYGRTLITGTRGLKRCDSWAITSARSGWCLETFRIFIIRTIAACIIEKHFPYEQAEA